MNDEVEWHRVGPAEDIEEEDVMRFDAGGATYAVYRTASGYYASDGHCTHEDTHLAEGFVMDEIIECPMHQGRFHIPSGKAKGAPVVTDLRTHPVKIEDGILYIGLPGAQET